MTTHNTSAVCGATGGGAASVAVDDVYGCDWNKDDQLKVLDSVVGNRISIFIPGRNPFRCRRARRRSRRPTIHLKCTPGPLQSGRWTCVCGWTDDTLYYAVKRKQRQGSRRVVVVGNNSICSVSANNFIMALRNMSIKSSALVAEYRISSINI